MAEVKRNEARDGEAGEGSRAFVATSQVSLDQLDAEVAKRMGWRRVIGMSTEGDPLEASGANPVTIWVSRPDLDADVFLEVAKSHEPRQQSDDEPTVDDIRVKLASGEPLTNQEMQVVLLALLDK